MDSNRSDELVHCIHFTWSPAIGTFHLVQKPRIFREDITYDDNSGCDHNNNQPEQSTIIQDHPPWISSAPHPLPRIAVVDLESLSLTQKGADRKRDRGKKGNKYVLDRRLVALLDLIYAGSSNAPRLLLNRNHDPG